MIPDTMQKLNNNWFPNCKPKYFLSNNFIARLFSALHKRSTIIERRILYIKGKLMKSEGQTNSDIYREPAHTYRVRGWHFREFFFAKDRKMLIFNLFIGKSKPSKKYIRWSAIYLIQSPLVSIWWCLLVCLSNFSPTKSTSD